MTRLQPKRPQLTDPRIPKIHNEALTEQGRGPKPTQSMKISSKAIAGSAATLGFLALMAVVAATDEPAASNPVDLPAAAPLSEQLEAPPAGAPREQPKEVPQATSTPNAAEPKALFQAVAEEATPRPASPQPTPLPVRSAGGDRDCPDFGSQAEAQRFFIANGGPSSDPHRLDRDNDGIACENN